MDHENTIELQTDWSDLILYNSGGSNNNNKTWHIFPVAVALNVSHS